jgi:cellulose synthase/poly-beta-1,6-N-acetylglucosamine synthase-like glycosyltransferase
MPPPANPSLDAAFAAAAPRLSPIVTPLRSAVIHGAVAVLFVVLLLRAAVPDGAFAWSVGMVYIGYDTVLLLFVFRQTLALARAPRPPAPSAPPAYVSVGVIVAAHNEAAALPATLAALAAQSDPPDLIVIADDGSTDATAQVLTAGYGMDLPPMGTLGDPSPAHPTLRWLRLPHSGKARALNQAITRIPTDLVLTVDGDTLLDPGAIAAMRAAFAADPGLVAATGVLTPVCGPGIGGRILQWFQTYEYVRNFLSRYAWMRADGLLLISGAFAAFRRRPVVDVGGFDPLSLVEDYELIHRLRRHAARHGLVWHTAVVGTARAQTDAPASVGAFLRQRRRWFGGFLQTQFWYRDMVGSPRYGRVGTAMMPVKALDTFQPLYGLVAFALLLVYAVTAVAGGHALDLLVPAAGFVGAKLVLDLSFHLWSVWLYRRWTGSRLGFGAAFLAAIAEPFSFQLLRHLGASLGWVTFLGGKREWGTPAPRTFAPHPLSLPTEQATRE